MKKYRLIMLIALLIISSLPVHAQDEPLTADEIELVNFVAAAYDNLRALDTYQAESEQIISQDIAMPSLDIHQGMDQDVSAQIQSTPNSQIDNLYSKTSRVMLGRANGQTTTFEITLETIIYDGEFYTRYGQPRPGIPAGWFYTHDLPGMETVTLDAIADLSGSNTLALYPVNEETVKSIVELEAETLDGLEMRVFEIEWNLPAIGATAALSDLFPPTAVGLTEDEYWQNYAENSTQAQRLWIGVEDNLIYRADMEVESVLEFPNTPQGALTIEQTITGSTRYFGFNEPVKIEVPIMGE